MVQSDDVIDLGDFVAEVLTQVISGINKAQEVAKEKHAIVNPEKVMDQGGILRVSNSGHSRLVEKIEFDIAVTAAKKADVKSATGIMIPVLALGVQGEKQYDNSMVSRIKFSIPVAFPVQK